MEPGKKWFIYVGDHHEGPFSADEVFQKIKSGVVNTPISETHVWCEGMADWQLMEQVPELKPLIAQLAKPKAPAPANIPAPKLEATQTQIKRAATATAAVSGKPSMTDELPEKDKKPKAETKSSLGIKLIGAVFFLAVVALGLLAGASRMAPEEVHHVLRPWMAKIIELVPASQPAFQMIPKLPDVQDETRPELEAALLGAPQSGAKIAIALAQTDPNRPYFYVSTNLPDQTKLDVYLVGNGETLLNRLQFSTSISVETRFGLGKTDAVLGIGAQPIPKGEYRVYVVESANQVDGVKNQLSSIPAQRNGEQAPAPIPPGTQFLIQKTLFIGGARDDTYLTRLKAFHEKIKQSSEREAQELKQYSDTLVMQFQALTQEFARVSKFKKPTPAQKAGWVKATQQWKQIHGQMEQTIQTWTPETLQNEFFYGKSYQRVKSAFESLHNLFKLESGFVDPTSEPQPDRAAFDIQHGKATSEARDSLDELKVKVDSIFSSPKTASGLPTREET